jgi:hypothetical protein
MRWRRRSSVGRSGRKPAADDGGGDDDNGLDEGAEEYLLRHIGFGAADLVQQVVGLDKSWPSWPTTSPPHASDSLSATSIKS